MPFLAHLEELRWRIIRAAIAIVIMAVLALIAKDFLFEVIIFGPVKEWFPTNSLLCKLSDALCVDETAGIFQALSLPSQVTVYILTGLVVGMIAAFPYVFYQFWSFIKPGLKDREAKEAKGMTFWISVLFFLGVLFGYYIIVPISVQFFLNFSVSEMVENKFTINSYVSTVTVLTLATGILFQLPMVVLLLTKIGLVTPEILKKYRKHALVAVLVLAAVITPPDFFSQVLIAIPIMVLYEVGILLSRRVIKRQRAAAI